MSTYPLYSFTLSGSSLVSQSISVPPTSHTIKYTLSCIIYVVYWFFFLLGCKPIKVSISVLTSLPCCGRSHFCLQIHLNIDECWMCLCFDSTFEPVYHLPGASLIKSLTLAHPVSVWEYLILPFFENYLLKVHCCILSQKSTCRIIGTK